MDEFGDTDPLLEHSDGDDDDDEVRPQVKSRRRSGYRLNVYLSRVLFSSLA